MMISGLSGTWHFQRVVLKCGCIAKIFGRYETRLERGDYWHCFNGHKGHHEGHGADVLVIDVLPATMADREQLTRVEQ